MEIPSAPESSFKVMSEDDQFRIYRLNDNSLVPGYDTLRLLNFLTGFADVRYEALLDEIIDPARKDSILNTPPISILTIIDLNSDTNAVKIFHKPNDEGAFDMTGNPYHYDVDRLYASINDGRDFVLIQYYSFDKILRPLQFFIPEGGMTER